MDGENPAGAGRPAVSARPSRAHERLALLDQAAQQIGSTLEVTRTAQELTEVAVPRLADFIAVDLLEGVADGEELGPGPVGEAAVLRRAAIRSVTEHAPEATYPVGYRMTFHPATPYAQCLASGEPLLIPKLDAAADWLAQDPARAAKIVESGIHSLMTVPLRARDVTLGLAHFYRWSRAGAFEPDDLLLAHDMVARAAVCVDNARRYTGEHRAAVTLQNSLLLHGAVPKPSPVPTAHCYLPARAHAGVGGDWFDVLPLSGARVGFVVGDVAGRGVPAIARAGRIRTAIRTLAGLDMAPDEVLAQVDRQVTRIADAHLAVGEEATAVGGTCLYVVYDRVTGRCVAASAGHLPPIVTRPGERPEALELPIGPPLGVGGLPFEAAEYDLPDGAVMALYTDGLIRDRHADPDVGTSRLLHALADTDLPLNELGRQAVEAVLGTQQPDDDAVLLLTRARALGTNCVASWDLPADPAIVGHTRALVSRQLASWNLEEQAPLTELIVSELITNAIRYGRAPLCLRLIRERTLISEVSDGSSTSPHLRHAAESDEGGRGLFMIAQIADDWGTRYTPTGKTIWAEQAFPLSDEA